MICIQRLLRVKHVLLMDSQHNSDLGQPMLAEIQFNQKSARESLIL